MEATGDRMAQRLVSSPFNFKEGFAGGKTTFMSGFNGPSERDVGVTPKIGRVLVFQHDILHEGSLLVAGTKYTMRTDVMYGEERH